MRPSRAQWHAAVANERTVALGEATGSANTADANSETAATGIVMNEVVYQVYGGAKVGRQKPKAKGRADMRGGGASSPGLPSILHLATEIVPVNFVVPRYDFCNMGPPLESSLVPSLSVGWEKQLSTLWVDPRLRWGGIYDGTKFQEGSGQLAIHNHVEMVRPEGWAIVSGLWYVS